MTIEELMACFEKHDDEYLKFERIENPRHPRPDLCAFLMLHDLVPRGMDMVASASHDEITLDTDIEALAGVVTDETVRDLRRCGIRLVEDSYLAMFV